MDRQPISTASFLPKGLLESNVSDQTHGYLAIQKVFLRGQSVRFQSSPQNSINDVITIPADSVEDSAITVFRKRSQYQEQEVRGAEESRSFLSPKVQIPSIFLVLVICCILCLNVGQKPNID